MIKVGINGFGRIGRLVLRILIEKYVGIIQVVAINEPNIDARYLAYQLKYDSVHGEIFDKIEVKNGSLEVNDIPIGIFVERNPGDIRWMDYDVDVVIESSGVFTTVEQANLHLKAGAKKVIISAPSSDAPMYIIGGNHRDYKGEKIISNASCTTNCLVPLLQILNNNFGIEEAFMTTVHSTTSSQRTVDGMNKKDWRLGRSSGLNIIPSSTGASACVEKILPELKGKIAGLSVRVPTVDVSMIDLSVRLSECVTYSKVMETIEEESLSRYGGIVGYTRDPLVSSDFIGDSRSCIVDGTAGLSISDTFIKIIGWYDNEWAYSNRLVDLLLFTHERKAEQE